MKPKSPRLKPCPWCGKTPELWDKFGGDLFQITCANFNKCVVRPHTNWDSSKVFILKVWNKLARVK